jgi:hypothetical protein
MLDEGDGRSLIAKRIGCDEEMLCAFLELLRDHYPIADKANYFLETKAGRSGINIAISNQRDALSHLVTFLNLHDDPKNQTAQLNNAEEHLRRSINEPYEVAVNLKIRDIETLYGRYKDKVMPLHFKGIDGFATARDEVSINAELREIGELRAFAKRTKGENLWNKSWEEGIKALIQAYERLIGLQDHMDEHLSRALHYAGERRHLHFDVAHIAFGVGGVVIGLVGSYLAYLALR